MFTLSYSLSSTLEDSLQKIEVLRRQILLTPLPPRVELRLRWTAMLNRIYWSLVLDNNPLSKTEIIKLITAQNKKKLTPSEKEVINYKKALDYISQNWFVNSRAVTPRTVLTLHNIACSSTLHLSQESLQHFLNYLQAERPENPIIQAAIAQIWFDGRTARLLALLFLYKHGYNFRDFLVLEEYWRRDLVTFREITQSVASNRNATRWLEYFAQGVVSQLEKVTQEFTQERLKPPLPSSFWELNDRQKEIVTMLEQPDLTITNRKVQKLFRVSQITASRDLAKLAHLGLVFARGKGRSVYYTKL